MFLGAAGGLMASHLPGFDLTPAVAVGIGTGVVSVLRLPLSAVVLATVLTAQAGPGSAPLVIVGVVVAHLTTLAASGRGGPAAPAGPNQADEPRERGDDRSAPA
jgi:hypothetical protein